MSRYLVDLGASLPITFAPAAPAMPPRLNRFKGIDHWAPKSSAEQRYLVLTLVLSSPLHQPCHHHQEKERNSQARQEAKLQSKISLQTHTGHKFAHHVGSPVLSEAGSDGLDGSDPGAGWFWQPDGSRPGLGLRLGCCCLRIQLAGCIVRAEPHPHPPTHPHSWPTPLVVDVLVNLWVFWLPAQFRNPSSLPAQNVDK